MAAITWRSLMQEPDYRGVGSIIGASQNSFNSAFDAFNRILKDRQSFEAGQAADVQEGIKQSYLDQLAGYKTPEALAAAQASGQLVAPVDRLTNANRANVRGAEDARLTGLRQAVTAEQQYTDQQATVAEKPILDAFNRLLQDKNFEGAEQTIPNIMVRDRAGLGAKLIAAKEAERLRVRGLTKEGEQDEKTKLEMTALRRAGVAAERADMVNTQSQRLATVLAREQASNAARKGEVGKEHGLYAKGLGFPVRADGVPDYASWTPKQRQMFDEEMDVIGQPKSSFMMGGDTAQGQDLYERINASGEFDPLVVDSFKDKILGNYNSAPAPLRGDDAHAQAVSMAKTQVGFERDDASNIYAPGSVDARKAYDDLSTKIPDIVKSAPNGYDQDEDVPAVQSLIGKWAVEGVKIPKGTTYDDGTVVEKDLYITPSVADVQRFVRSAEPGIGGWFKDSSRANAIEKDMTNWLKSSAALSLIKRGMESQQYRDGQRVNQLIREAVNPPKK